MTFGPGVPWSTLRDELDHADASGAAAQQEAHVRQDEVAAKAREQKRRGPLARIVAALHDRLRRR